MYVLTELLTKAVEAGASDIHVVPERAPLFRVRGNMIDSGFEPIARKEIAGIIEDILPDHSLREFEETQETDFSLEAPGLGRFRVNAFMAQGRPTLALRYVQSDIPTFDSLNLPKSLKSLAKLKDGVVLITGTTGAGKSSTLAAIIGEINRTQRRRIITVEDPVEYQFIDDRSTISQREVGLDTESYQAALKRLLRQDPDVIMIGEMRDALSIQTALMAAETGHLVLTTLHAGTADQALPRILDVFPHSEQEPIRNALAVNLRAVVCQRLMPRKDKKGGLYPAVEIMVRNPTIRKMILENQLDRLRDALEASGKQDGSQSFNDSIYEALKAGAIDKATAMRQSSNPEQLKMRLKGIVLDEGKRILG